MKKVKVIGLSVLLFIMALAGGFWYYMNYFLPHQIATSIVNDEDESVLVQEDEGIVKQEDKMIFIKEDKNIFIPQKIKEQIKTGKKIVSANIEKVDTELERLNVSYEDIEVVINEVNPDDVIKTIDILSKTELISTDQVFDIVKSNIRVNHLDVEIFRESFRQNVNLGMINKALKKLRENNLLASVSIPVAKETAKQILKVRKDKIARELNEINTQN